MNEQRKKIGKKDRRGKRDRFSKKNDSRRGIEKTRKKGKSVSKSADNILNRPSVRVEKIPCFFKCFFKLTDMLLYTVTHGTCLHFANS